jgi:lipopolysaccharide export system protein LptA
MYNRLLFFLLLSFFTSSLFSQDEKKTIEILNADLLRFSETNGRKITRLVGDVQLLQDNVLMYCDSALMDKEANTFDAFGRVHIEQDNTHTYASILYYDGNTKMARLKNNVVLTDGKARIETQELYYDMSNKITYYIVGGRVYREESIIKSRAGYYYTNTGDVFFRGNVDIEDPKYKLTSDTLKYNVDTDITTFFGNTTIYNDENEIKCNNGWYDTKQNVASFGKNTKIINSTQVLDADSLYYDRNKSYGKAMNGFIWRDTSMNVEIHAQRGDFFEERKRIYAYQKAFAIYNLDNDSLFISGDTLFSQEKSETDTTKVFQVFRNSKIFMRSMQGVCDSLYYDMADSTFRFYVKPVLWSDSTQLSGDSIHLVIKNKQADLITLYNNSLIVSPEDKYYNQIQGRIVYGYFKENALDKMNVRGNAESLYFGKDDKEKYIGANRAKSANLDMYFGDKKISKVVFIDKPEAVFIPNKMLTNDDQFLNRFQWLIKRKPQSREEVMHKQNLNTQ